MSGASPAARSVGRRGVRGTPCGLGGGPRIEAQSHAPHPSYIGTPQKVPLLPCPIGQQNCLHWEVGGLRDDSPSVGLAWGHIHAPWQTLRRGSGVGTPFPFSESSQRNASAEANSPGGGKPEAWEKVCRPPLCRTQGPLPCPQRLFISSAPGGGKVTSPDTVVTEQSFCCDTFFHQVINCPVSQPLPCGEEIRPACQYQVRSRVTLSRSWLSLKTARQVGLILVTGALCTGPSAPTSHSDTLLRPSQQHQSPRIVPAVQMGLPRAGRRVRPAGLGLLGSSKAASEGCHREGAGRTWWERGSGEGVLWCAASPCFVHFFLTFF